MPRPIAQKVSLTAVCEVFDVLAQRETHRAARRSVKFDAD